MAEGESPIRRLGESWARFRRSFGRRRIDWIYSRDYRLALGSVPMDPLRGERILTYLLAAGLTTARCLFRPDYASLKLMRRVHTDAYLEGLHLPGAMVPVFGFDVDDLVQEMALAAQRAAVGGTLLASRRALDRRGVAVNLGGGLHHATPDSGRGFCIFNDVAVSIAALRADGFDEPVLVVDLDIHDGNGTRAVFADDPSVFTFSIHNQNWDDAAALASLSIELGDDVGDEAYLAELSEHLPAVLEGFRPGLVYFLAGTDPAADDRMGNWRISAAGLFERDRFVIDLLRGEAGDPPLAILLAGGYGSRTWRYSARTFGWLVTGESIEPPSTEAITLARYRRLTEFLDPSQLSEEKDNYGDEDGDFFKLTEEDLFGGAGVVAPKTRLLGYFSRHGLELLLESAGLLDQLRRRGFAQPTLDFDLDNPAGETFRVYGDATRGELLVEARLGLDLRTMEGLDLMRIEWLLLQNPRASFTGREPLPGQKHPGLGLLSDIMAIMVLICERRQLDGILFVPSHYHLAVKGRKYLRFIDPVDEAWAQAVQRTVSHLPLAEATRAVDEGRVVDNATGETVHWHPMHMALPISEKLREHLRSDDYEARVGAASRDLRLESAG